MATTTKHPSTRADSIEDRERETTHRYQSFLQYLERKSRPAIPTTFPARREPNGIVVYAGPSRFDGTPIVAILTGLRSPSTNVKTGRSVQLWILPDPRVYGLPHAHDSHAGACGTCDHQPSKNGTCYVVLFQGPRAVADAFLRGVYPALPEYPLALVDVLDSASRKSSLLRFGAWGDPAALPLSLLRMLAHAAVHNGMDWTGYTHAWKRYPALRSLLMASVDTVAERMEAQSKGWRTFHVLPSDGSATGGDIICPATRMADVTCATCHMCGGTGERDALTGERVHSTGRMRSIAVHAHGATASRVSA